MSAFLLFAGLVLCLLCILWLWDVWRLRHPRYLNRYEDARQQQVDSLHVVRSFQQKAAKGIDRRRHLENVTKLGSHQ